MQDPPTADAAQSGPGASPSPSQVTLLLHAAAAGDGQAFEKLMGVVYGELHALAQARMSHERRGHTLQPTALVNEAYVRLLGRDDIQWASRAHFFRAAAEAMRKILIDHARARNADKRGGGKAALRISSIADPAVVEDSAGFLALDEAIVRLEGVDAQAAAVVRLKFYGGLNDDGVAGALSISERTVRREWAFARGWLRDALERELQ
jgi:RNA polymerase sigma factor (TIGR02999 family)